MLKGLAKADWLNILNFPESRIPKVLIMRGTRNFRSKYRAMLPYFDNVLDVGTPNGIIEDVMIGDVRGQPVGFACVYGSAMASEIVHIFGVLGARAVIQIGNCGALADGFAAGDLFVAERAYCGEGAAQYYMPDGKWATASTELLQSRTLSALRSEECRIGAIYTTGALLAEGMEDVDRWFKEGFAAVDMETAATFAVAESFDMKRISLLYAFDNPRQKEHLLLSDKDKDVRRATANDRMRQLALDLAVEVSATAGAGAIAPSTGPRIRDCRPDEIEAVLRLWKEAETTVSATDSAANILHAITDSPAIVLVAEAEGHIIGSLIGGFDGWRGNVYRLAVHPTFRRQGIAQKLVGEVHRRLAGVGAKRMTALVLNDHPWATGFWAAAEYKLDQRMVRFARNLDTEK
jgi:purine-nucleoside phosphorylase/predicted N-acetyltransferase YhbS